jgi:hypothetical protein
VVKVNRDLKANRAHPVLRARRAIKGYLALPELLGRKASKARLACGGHKGSKDLPVRKALRVTRARLARPRQVYMLCDKIAARARQNAIWLATLAKRSHR